VKIYAKYIAGLYLKYLFILFVALECFYVGVDILTNLKDFPNSANLQLLYVVFTALIAVNYTLPLSMIFALIIAKFNMIRSNELICLYSLGMPKNSLIMPPFIIAMFISACFVALNCTPFAYALEFQKSLVDMTHLSDKTSKEMLLRYGNKFVFIREMSETAKSATDVKLFDVNAGNIMSYSVASKAVYDDKEWKFDEVNTTIFPSEIKLGSAGYETKFTEKLADLGGFAPKSIAKIYDSSNSYSIIDALNSIRTFKSQKIDISSVKAALYSMIFSPFFAPFMVLILYYFLPLSGRFFNLALLSFIFIIVTLCLWGILFILTRFSVNGVILPEIGIILPILALFAYGGVLYFRHR